MASQRTLGFVVAAASGIAVGMYALAPPLKEVSKDLSGHGPATGEIKDGRSQAYKDGTAPGGSAHPQASLRQGGASLISREHQTVAGRTGESYATGSADHNPKFRDNATVHDGTSGGGMGVAEMRERKMQGQGLPSPQGGDTKAKPVQATANEGEGGGIARGPKQHGGGDTYVR